MYYIILIIQGLLFISNITMNIATEIIFIRLVIILVMVGLILIEVYKRKKAISIYNKELIDKIIDRNNTVKKLEALAMSLMWLSMILFMIIFYTEDYERYKELGLQIVLLSSLVHSLTSVYKIYQLKSYNKDGYFPKNNGGEE